MRLRSGVRHSVCRTRHASGIVSLRERGWRSLLSLRDPAGAPARGWATLPIAAPPNYGCTRIRPPLSLKLDAPLPRTYNVCGQPDPLYTY
jgi:hypothetical protein